MSDGTSVSIQILHLSICDHVIYGTRRNVVCVKAAQNKSVCSKSHYGTSDGQTEPATNKRKQYYLQP